MPWSYRTMNRVMKCTTKFWAANAELPPSLVASESSILKDAKKLVQLGFEEGIGLMPFGEISWRAFKLITRDQSWPVRAAAAKVLSGDPDPASTKALAQAVGDKNPFVRQAVLRAENLGALFV